MPFSVAVVVVSPVTADGVMGIVRVAKITLSLVSRGFVPLGEKYA